MDGFLLAFKEKGISSNQVVQQTKRLFSLKKVGHLGTLDPMAEGLLVLAVNRATRFSSFFLESDKKYEAEVSFGAKTDTDDAMGEVIESSSYVPKETDIKQELNKFLGESLQNPPFFSALKHKGKPLYKYAREGSYSVDIASSITDHVLLSKDNSHWYEYEMSPPPVGNWIILNTEARES